MEDVVAKVVTLPRVILITTNQGTNGITEKLRVVHNSNFGTFSQRYIAERQVVRKDSLGQLSTAWERFPWSTGSHLEAHRDALLMLILTSLVKMFDLANTVLPMEVFLENGTWSTPGGREASDYAE